MIKKRLIFTLLYSDNFFFQSRNFNIQKVGDISWLEKNYNFKNISYYIDELIILDISRNKKNKENFIKNINKISEFCFVPITVGGGIKSLEDAKFFLKNGSDKILINSSIFENFKIINQITEVYGEQSVVLGIDLKKIDNNYFVYSNNGQKKINENPKKIIQNLQKSNFGELLLNSINQDGTGMGIDYSTLDLLPTKFNKPLILSGGTGNFKHILEGLEKKFVSAISTSNLLNFVGDGLIKTRNKLLSEKIDFPNWDIELLQNLKSIFNDQSK